MKRPLRTVLRSFLNHFEDYEARKKLCDDQYEYEFQQLKTLTDKLKVDPDYPCSCAIKDINRPKNRYKDIVPFDKSRVILPKSDGVPGSDYINASYVKGSSGALAYIAAQGPLPNTVLDFWRMVWVCEVQVLVMACNEKEVGKSKCEVYWPSKGEVCQFGNITIELIQVNQVCPDFLVRTLLVKCDSEMRDVYQFHYTSWPDHGVPNTVHPILELVRLMRECQASETVPILVHCSAGCGRTGTICAVDYVWACLRHGKLTEDFSLFEIALELRRQRIAMIQTKEQYILAHKAVATLFEQQLNVIDCHPYVNIDEDGEPLMWKELAKNKALYFKNKKSKTESTSDLPVGNEKSITIKKESEGSSNAETSPTTDSSLSTDTLTSNSSSESKLQAKMSISDSMVSSRNSEISLSRNSCLSQQSHEDRIPFIDEEEVSIRPNCGRAYLNIPSCNSYSKIVNCFDPFVDKVSMETDDSSPDSDSKMLPLDSQSRCDSVREGLSESALSSSTAMMSSYATLPCSSKSSQLGLLLPNRDSFPPATASRLDSASDVVNCSSKDPKRSSKVNVVRRPSISKLRALFEKSGIGCGKSNEGGKRSLFRNNSHSVSRAGSAPPSLNCMDKSTAVERESILMMVTRKFRSASVRMEREVSPKPTTDKPHQRKSNAMTNFKEGFNSLSRTVSFNLSKKFRSYSPSKTDKESTPSAENARISFTSEDGGSKPKLPEVQYKGRSVWYDRSSVNRAVAIVKPTEKVSEKPDTASISPTEKQCLDNNIPPPNKPSKLLPFFGTKPIEKEASAMWYSEPNENIESSEIKGTQSFTKETEEAKCFKATHKVIPFIHSFSSWKKVGVKSPMMSPESPKKTIFSEGDVPGQSSNSTFYAEINEQGSSLPEKNIAACPVPEEIIPLVPKAEDSTENVTSKNSDPEVQPVETNPVSPSLKPSSLEVQAISQTILDHGQKNIKDLDRREPVKEISNESRKRAEAPPAIPKKTLIGKNKNLANQMFFGEEEKFNTNGATKEISSSVESLKKNTQSAPVSPKDNYTNVNIAAQKNIEQIETTLRNCPRGAIIDLTSRESYCMEEELDNALRKLSVSSEPKANPIKANQKFPGYEVIWPEDKLYDKDRSEVQSGLLRKSRTGICYSPPLRRSVNSNSSLSKCLSCSNIDWMEPDANVSLVSIPKETNSPTKKLVTEAVVELNTLLDQLTTRTLSEDSELISKPKQKVTASHEKEVTKQQQEKENPLVHSVTLLSKSTTSDSSVKEEEIIFHFPPPPPLPPPDDVQPSGTFHIVRKNGCLIVSESDKLRNKSAGPSTSNQGDSSGNMEMPQPMPRKSKQGDGLKRSASYTNVSINPNGRYENVFLEKYQTISRLQIDSNDLSNVPNSPGKSKVRQGLPDYVNTRDLNIRNPLDIPRKPTEPHKDIATPPTARASLSLKHQLLRVHKDLEMGDEMTKSCPPSAFKGPSMDYDDSTYGSISKLPIKNPMISNKTPDMAPDSQKKPRKSERAPLPPGMQMAENQQLKKGPSRKLEKAPLPPPLLQKSTSTSSIPKKNLPSYYNLNPSRPLEENSVLPAVRENISNAEPNSYIPVKKGVETDLKGTKTHSLSHSRSDASVFLALKERKSQLLKRGPEGGTPKPPLLNKPLIKSKELHSVSSSDSDSSYERIFFDKPLKQTQKSSEKELAAGNLAKSSQQELPVAPPRSRRRNTTEVQYAKVKSKEGSSPSSYKINHLQNKPHVEQPPAIPLKTKDAFEIP